MWGQGWDKTGNSSSTTYTNAKNVFLLNPENLVPITRETTDEEVLKALISWYYSAGQNEVTLNSTSGKWEITNTTTSSTESLDSLEDILDRVFNGEAMYENCTSFAIVPVKLADGMLFQIPVIDNRPVYKYLGLVNGSDLDTVFKVDMADVVDALDALNA